MATMAYRPNEESTRMHYRRESASNAIIMIAYAEDSRTYGQEVFYTQDG